MSNCLVIVFGANGGVASMIMPYLVDRQDLKVVTCGRKPWASTIPHYPWSFGQEPPISRIIDEHPSSNAVTVLYSAISWPRSEEDIKINTTALASVSAALPSGARLVSLSSFVVNTPSQTRYAKLKRLEEDVCCSQGGISLRLGLIDSVKPFGQSGMFVGLARMIHMVPVPFPRAVVVLSTEAGIISAVLSLIGRQYDVNCHVVEVRSAEMLFIDAIRHILTNSGARYVCVPISDLITKGLLSVCGRVAPNSWLSERLRGLQAFSSE